VNFKRLLIAVVALAYVAVCGYAMELYGYLGVIRLATANAGALTVSVDLAIALTMVLVWVAQDARKRKISALPYLLVTLAFGSLGPLIYLFRIAGEAEVSAISAPHPARA
jgi:uncharacterized protein DUF2834